MSWWMIAALWLPLGFVVGAAVGAVCARMGGER